MFCPVCGNKNKEGSEFCSSCGSSMKDGAAASTTTTTAPATNGSNSMAIAGFVLGIISLFCCAPLNILGLIFSIVGMTQAKVKGGKGLAIAGIIISIVSIVLVILLIALAAIYPDAFDFHFDF